MRLRHVCKLARGLPQQTRNATFNDHAEHVILDRKLQRQCQSDRYHYLSVCPQELPLSLPNSYMLNWTCPKPVSSAIHTQPKDRYYKTKISQESNGDISLHPGGQVNLDLQVQLDADLERAVLLLGVALFVQVRARGQCGFDVFRIHGGDFLVRHVRDVFELLSAAQRRGRGIVEKCSVWALSVWVLH